MRELLLEKSPAALFTDWLCNLVSEEQFTMLAALRRPGGFKGPGFTAAHFAPLPTQQPVFEYVAFLFACYHAERGVPDRGYGDMGSALRRVGSGAGRGPGDPGAARLMDRLVTSHHIPRRPLHLAIARIRTGGTMPPSWTRLTEDLSVWKAREPYGRNVRYDWVRSFCLPTPAPVRTLATGGST
ncbi:CRISPR system Cascade subunit CasB [Kitasatospora sp. GAS204A]|uniref:type I-E CRISPR-associated protein Cse2/CasB n=1 Tax=unclassified Kitasatospora TaxID=2633591 RepID=UPI00247314DD|nr:type I-E CRISPR-associated protein Cse2/CasB [Kitasatospora sp. GAS204B]MDH6122823.1 CRISPR system Cascade subunit CasB [Kitasatospora sp. GAS204B]